MKVKDVVAFFNSFYGFDCRCIANFYDEDGFYVAQIDRDYAGEGMFVSRGARAIWENKVKLYKRVKVGETIVYTFIVLKGEEK